MTDVPHERSPELDGRTAAVRAVADALSGRRFVNESLRRWRVAGRLVGREAALATEVGQGAVRHLLTIEHILGRLARYDRARLAPRLRAILCTAAYQIIWMDRIPPFAAVDQAVELARRLVRGRAPTLVNAVLRRITDTLSERREPWHRLDPAQVRVSWDQACRFSVPVLPDPQPSGHAAYLAAVTGERPGRYAALVVRYGPERAEAVAWASQAVPVAILQRNPLRAEPEVFAQALRTSFGESVELAGDAAFIGPSSSILDTPAFTAGLAFVQDATAHAAARAVAAQPGERVLDLCAAPGGKSVVLALDLRDRGEIVACDRVSGRLALVEENLARLGLKCVRTQLLPDEATDVLDSLPRFDAALVDVPCSNTGVIARRPEARLGLTPRKLRALVETQRQLLRQAAACLRPGGRLVYSTCSLEPEENEQVVAEFLAENPRWRLDLQETTLPAWGPRLSDWHDGGYFARLVQTTGHD